MKVLPGCTATRTAYYTRTRMLMDTSITIEIAQPVAGAAALVARAFDWFGEVEARCSRFEPESELRQLLSQVGAPVPVSPILFEALAFALAVAHASGGAFDPTIGATLEQRGFDRNYRTGEPTPTGIAIDRAVTYRDLRLNPARQSVTLRRPLLLDLGAVAKGLAVDLAARALAPARNFVIDAGGDLYVAGRNPAGEDWSIGVGHPHRPDTLLTTLRLSDVAICTSGNTKRRSPHPGLGHHLLDPRDGQPVNTLASVTTIAPTALAADALATAAFVLGPQRGLRLLERQGVDGLLVTPGLDQFTTLRFDRYH